MDDSSSYIETGKLFAEKLYQDNDIDIKDAYYSTQGEDKYVTLNRAYIESVFVLLVKRYEIDFKEKENITNFKNFITYLFICYVYHFYKINMQFYNHNEYCIILNDNILNILNETFDINGCLQSYFKTHYTEQIKLNHLFNKDVRNAIRIEQEAIKREDEARRGEEEARRREEEAKKKLEIARRLAEEARSEEERIRREEEERRRRREEEEKAKRETEARREAEEKAKREEEARKREEEARKEEARRLVEEEARKQQEEETRRVAEEEARKREARRLVDSQLDCKITQTFDFVSFEIVYNYKENFLYYNYNGIIIQFYHICFIRYYYDKKNYYGNKNMFLSNNKKYFLYLNRTNFNKVGVTIYNLIQNPDYPFYDTYGNRQLSFYNIMQLNINIFTSQEILDIIKFYNNQFQKNYIQPRYTNSLEEPTGFMHLTRHSSSRYGGGYSKNDLNKIYGIYILFLNKLLLRNKDIIPKYKKQASLHASA